MKSLFLTAMLLISVCTAKCGEPSEELLHRCTRSVVGFGAGANS